MNKESLQRMIDNHKQSKVEAISDSTYFPGSLLIVEVASTLPALLLGEGIPYGMLKMVGEDAYFFVTELPAASEVVSQAKIWKGFPVEVGTVESILFLGDAYVRTYSLKEDGPGYKSMDVGDLSAAFKSGAPSVREAIVWTYVDRSGHVVAGQTHYEVTGTVCEMKDTLDMTCGGEVRGRVVENLATVFSQVCKPQ